MKKAILLSASALTFAIGSVLLTGCAKEDLVAPTITLTGDDEVTLNLGETYTDAGVTASDDEDGDVTSQVSVTGSVNTDEVGEYIIHYNVSDAAGNNATEVTRTVKVKSDLLAGAYSVSDVVTGCTPSSNNGTYAYNVTISQSSTDFNKILISNFGGLGSSVSIYATINGSVITIPSQPATGANPTTNVSGTGTYVKAGSIFKVTTLNYTASNVFFGTGNATYTKQ